MAAKKKTVRKTSRKATRKTRSAMGRKAVAKQTPSGKTAARTSKKAAQRATDRIVEIKPARGETWVLRLSSGGSVAVPAAAAQTAGVRVGGVWSDAVARRLAAAERAQELFAQAMGFLASNGKATAAQVIALLGGGREAAQTAKSLVEHGWLRR